MPDRSDRGRRVALGGVALVVCCVGHALLLTGGLAGLGTAIGAATADTVLLVPAAVILAVTAAVAVSRIHRRRAADRIATARKAGTAELRDR